MPAGGNNGSGSISAASDVSLSNPAGNQTLQYDSATLKWKNASLTKASVGLGSVDNTADVDKPVSTATQAALSAKAAITQARPEIRYNSSTSAWPTRSSSIPAGYSGPVTWWSALDLNVAAPTDAQTGDDWIERVA
jgi:hypothetical protein